MLLVPHLYTEEGTPPNVDEPMKGRIGPKFVPAGEGKAWRDLTITVTSEEVTAEWDGQTLHLNREEIAAAVAAAMDRLRPLYPEFPLLQSAQPQFAPRGGLGLYLYRGSASFRDVTVTPLTEDR